MSKTISIDLRRRVAAFVDDGHSCRAAARQQVLLNQHNKGEHLGVGNLRPSADIY